MCEVMFLLEENALEIHCEKDFILQHRIGKKSGQLPAITNLTDRTLGLSYRDYAYQIMLESGIFEDALTIRSENGIVRASFGAR